MHFFSPFGKVILDFDHVSAAGLGGRKIFDFSNALVSGSRLSDLLIWFYQLILEAGLTILFSCIIAGVAPLFRIF